MREEPMVNRPTIPFNCELKRVDDINLSAVLCSEKCSYNCNPDRQRPRIRGPRGIPPKGLFVLVRSFILVRCSDMLRIGKGWLATSEHTR